LLRVYYFVNNQQCTAKNGRQARIGTTKVEGRQGRKGTNANAGKDVPVCTIIFSVTNTHFIFPDFKKNPTAYRIAFLANE
jgi:hypothetical protein